MSPSEQPPARPPDRSPARVEIVRREGELVCELVHPTGARTRWTPESPCPREVVETAWTHVVLADGYPFADRRRALDALRALWTADAPSTAPPRERGTRPAVDPGPLLAP